MEFQTPDMLEELVANQGIEVFLTVEEAEALARAAKAGDIEDRRTRALADQALDQIAAICRRVRERVGAGDKMVDRWGEQHPSPVSACHPPRGSACTRGTARSRGTSQPRYRPLGDPDNLSLKEAGEILGKARNTVYLWYRKGKFPPAVDIGRHLGQSKPVIVVPRYRLEAWIAGKRMPSLFQEIFELHGLREPPWGCWTARRGAARQDIAFWVERRELQTGVSKEGKRIYGQDLEEGKVYELSDREL